MSVIEQDIINTTCGDSHRHTGEKSPSTIFRPHAKTAAASVAKIMSNSEEEARLDRKRPRLTD